MVFNKILCYINKIDIYVIQDFLGGGYGGGWN